MSELGRAVQGRRSIPCPSSAGAIICSKMSLREMVTTFGKQSESPVFEEVPSLDELFHISKGDSKSASEEEVDAISYIN